MELTIGAWYNEPEYSFNFSYRIEKFIRLAIKQCIMAPLGLLESYPEKFLHLQVTTTPVQETLEVKMGPLKAKATSINFGLWFPYKTIVDSVNPLESYVECYIKSIPLVFQRWGVTDQQSQEAAKMIRAEIIGNPYYELTQEEKEELVEEKKSMDKILKESGLE